jgi:hypothetical protein
MEFTENPEGALVALTFREEDLEFETSGIYYEFLRMPFSLSLTCNI